MSIMEFQNLRSSRNVLSFDIYDVDLSVVNALRRIILAEIPTLALMYDPLVETNPDIKITMNTSPLHNEFLAHRLSLIPVYFSDREVEDFDSAKYTFKLQVKNTSSDIISVTTKDIKIYDEEGNEYPDKLRNKVFPSDPFTKDHVLITKLRPNIYTPDKGEEVNIEWKVSKNIAKVHARWSPVSCCTLSNIVDDNLAASALEAKLKEAKQSRGRSLTPSEEESITKGFNTLDRFRHFMKNKHDEARAFHFKVESECGLSPEYLMTKAFDLLMAKLEMFKAGEFDIHPIDDQMIELWVMNEDFTLVNTLQSLIYNIKVRNDRSLLSFIGYTQPHPLDKKMIMKLKFEKSVDKDDVIDFMQNATEECIKYINTAKDAWTKSVN